MYVIKRCFEIFFMLYFLDTYLKLKVDRTKHYCDMDLCEDDRVPNINLINEVTPNTSWHKCVYDKR